MLGRYEANMVEGKDGWILSPSFLKLIQDRLSHQEEPPSLETIEIVLLAFDEIRDK